MSDSEQDNYDTSDEDISGSDLSSDEDDIGNTSISV